MMRSMLSRIALPLFVITCSTAQAEEAKAPTADAARGKAIATSVCAACHAADGNSTISANPKLAGQHAEYLSKQLKDFKSSARANPVMTGMASGLSDAQMADLAAYFAAQKPANNSAKSKQTIELGQNIYRAGNQKTGLPACAACHGPAGAGLPAQYPRLAGQYAEYTEAQLKSFRASGTDVNDKTGRANDPNKMMRMVAAKMNDVEIKAVADYIAGLR